MLKIRYFLLLADPIAACKILCVEKSFKMQIIRHAPLYIRHIVPIIEPRLDLFIFDPLMNDFSIIERQLGKVHALAE